MNLKISEISSALRWGLLLGLGLAALAGLELGDAAQRAARIFPPPLARSLPHGLSSFSLAAALGDGGKIAADIGYIHCLQYMGGANASDSFWGKTLPLYQQVQWLDPGFKHAIYEGISALGWLYRRPPEAETLALAAIAADRRNAGYAVYIAALAYQKKLDSADVLALLEPQARSAGAPEMLVRVVGNLLVQRREWPQALDYWTWVQNHPNVDDNTLYMARRTLKEIARHLAAPPAAIPSTRPRP